VLDTHPAIIGEALFANRGYFSDGRAYGLADGADTVLAIFAADDFTIGVIFPVKSHALDESQSGFSQTSLSLAAR
jgi:hypothetical protein